MSTEASPTKNRKKLLNKRQENRRDGMRINEMNIVDFHAHILPCADHGSSSLDVSVKQLTLAKNYGVEYIVATPHFYPDSHNVDAFLERRNKSFETLSPSLSDGMPKIALGAEVLICDGIERLDGLEKLLISGTNLLLLELPFSVFKVEYRDSVSRLMKSGIDVVLAHADRYAPENIDMLVECGARIQLNAHALSGLFVKSHVKNWLRDGVVVALGSDIHGADDGAYKRFTKAKSRIEKLGVQQQLLGFSDFLEKIF